MITVVRRDLTHGYQTAQTAHVVAEFAGKFPFTFWRWRKKSGFLICLSVRDKVELDNLIQVLDRRKLKYTKFFEPDVGEVTAIALAPHPEADRITKYLSLANKDAGTFDKNKK